MTGAWRLLVTRGSVPSTRMMSCSGVRFGVSASTRGTTIRMWSRAPEQRTRPGMQTLLGFAKPGETVVVWLIDWLGRSLLGVLSTVHELRDRDIAKQSIADGIGPTTITERLMPNMLGIPAECERELIIEPVNAGRRIPEGSHCLRPPGVGSEGDRREASACGGSPGSG